MEFRIEKDTMGEVQVPADALYGAQTQRSIDNFKIAQDINKMPKEIIKAFAYLKKATLLARFVMKFWKENWMPIFRW
jgi:fumarate hydratase class II